MGSGDLHNKKYDDYEVSTGWNAFLGGSQDIEDIDKSSGQCIYRVRVYPTKDMEDSFMTKTPMYFTVVLVVSNHV